MATVMTYSIVNGFYCFEYCIIDGNRCVPGKHKEIHVGFINHTGSLKYIIDISCASNVTYIALSINGNAPSDIVRDTIKLPPAYWRKSAMATSPSQVKWVFYAHADQTLTPVFQTSLDGEIVVNAHANKNDPDAQRVASSHPKTYHFNPSLENN